MKKIWKSKVDGVTFEFADGEWLVRFPSDPLTVFDLMRLTDEAMFLDQNEDKDKE
jgi:hypothetical protein